MHALIIHQKWLNKILDGSKTWELRGSRTAIRGEIRLIRKGSGKIMRTAELTEVVGPLTKHDLTNNFNKHQIPDDELRGIIIRYKKPYAWVLNDVKRFDRPVHYHHPQGAVVWVKVGDF